LQTFKIYTAATQLKNKAKANDKVELPVGPSSKVPDELGKIKHAQYTLKSALFKVDLMKPK
jgi:hypothetical protein